MRRGMVREYRRRTGQALGLRDLALYAAYVLLDVPDANAAISAAHGTTRSIYAKNSRLRVRLVLKFNPSSACFMRQIVAASSCPRHQAWT
jgi:hypothetical protein